MTHCIITPMKDALPFEATSALTHHSTHRLPVVTVAAVPIVNVRIEVEFAPIARTALVERTRPIEAVKTAAEETVIVETTRSGEENAVTVFASHFSAVDSVLNCPSCGTIIHKFLHFCIGWHAPL